MIKEVTVDARLDTIVEAFGHIPPGDIQVLHTNLDSRATLFVPHIGGLMLVHEDCDYRPMEYHTAERRRAYLGRDDFPHVTDGTRTYIDARTGYRVVRSFEAEEGQIQGIVYALSALTFGGEASAETYRNYIQHCVGEELQGFNAESWKQVDASTLDELGLVDFSRAILLQQYGGDAE